MTLSDRARWAAHGAVAALPEKLRGRAEAQNDAGAGLRLKQVLGTWARGSRMGTYSFAAYFFGPTASAEAAATLHDAAHRLRSAETHADLRAASERLADAIQQIGLDRWPGFLAAAQDRARDPATTAAIGIIGGGVLAGAVRQAVGAVAKRLGSKDEPPTPTAKPPGTAATAKPAATPQQAAPNPSQFVKPPTPANPNDLLQNGWEETSHRNAAENGHRRFVNPQTGQEVEFDEGTAGKPRWRGRDHYHFLNPDRTNDTDWYLDIDGNPVSDGSSRSHISPGS